MYCTGFKTIFYILTASFFALSCKARLVKEFSENVVTVYLLIDTPQVLQNYIDDLNRVDKVNFNRVIFSFVKPTMPNYVSGSLANTGIMGYFDYGDGNGSEAFELLKAAVALSNSKSVQSFLSVGGWNYSCNYEVYGEKCGDLSNATNGIHYDYFPDPNDPNEADIARISYNNVIALANDLEMDGIDVDAEEFWHADKFAVQWNGNPWATSIANEINDNGGPTYANVEKYGTGSITQSGPAFLGETITKMNSILHLLQDNVNSAHILFSTAAPPVGARPITGFVYGDTSPEIYTYGGLWWLGNLKGLWYHLADLDSSLVSRFDSLGLMTYDLCGAGSACQPYGGGPVDLAGQVDAYVADYNTWLKNPSPRNANLTVDNVGKVIFYPATFNIASKIQFGFEVNQPAYPKDESGQLQLTDELVDSILKQQSESSSGVIIWQMYSIQNVNGGGTTVQYTMQQSCLTFLKEDSSYDCYSDFPYSANH